jgi:glycerol dehydrogenase-like iron-containing ADH family enzyme
MIPIASISCSIELLDFIERLQTGFHHVGFEDGEMTIVVGDGAFAEMMSMIPSIEQIFPRKLRTRGVHRTFSSDWSIAVGGAQQFELARAHAAKSNTPYVVCPKSLSTDAFATDRYHGNLDQAAMKGYFASAIVLDSSFLAEPSDREQSLGLGEAIGLLTSLHDQSQCTNVHLPSCFLSQVESLLVSLAKSWLENAPRAQRLLQLAFVLMFKGLLIRTFGGNGPIASCDHLIAYELRRRGYQARHGTLVILGLLLSAKLVLHNAEEWVTRAAEIAFKYRLLEREDLVSLLNLDLVDVLLRAPRNRPQRETILHQVTPRSALSSVNLAREVILAHVGDL